MNFIPIFIIVLALAGCATVADPITVPVSVPCFISKPTAPSLQFTPPYKELFPMVRDLKGDRVAMTAYITSLEAAIVSCTK